MAKKKKQRRKQPAKVIHLSAEKYIKTKARTLPIKECLITDGWQEMGLATVMVAREQPSGHLTVGIFLVDTMCLGVKDTFYYQNMSRLEYKELLENIDKSQQMISCTYVEAHNIIYGAIAFAEEFGFTPHKDFNISQYILEEDDEKIALLEYEFGRDGKPVLFVKAGMNPNRYISQLKKSVGEGNYEVVYQENEWGDDEAWDEDEEENDWPDLDMERPFQNIIARYAEDMVQERTGNPQELRLEQMQISYEPMDSEYDKNYPEEKDSIHDALTETHELVLGDEEDIKTVIPMLREYIKKYPEYPPFYNYLSKALAREGQNEEADEVVRSMYSKFPDYLFAKIGYAELYFDEEKYEEAFQVIGQSLTIKQLYPDRELFHYTEVLAFNLFMCEYFVRKDEAKKAVAYYQIMYNLSEDHPMTLGAESLLGTALLKDSLGKLIEEAKLEQYEDETWAESVDEDSTEE